MRTRGRVTRTQKRGGNESQKHCPRDSEKTAEKIAAVAGVSPRTIKNDAHFAEAVDVLVADSVPMATRSLILSERLCVSARR